jgi:hypothetical protein
MMTDHEKLLIDTIEDLKNRLDKGGEYNLIRASALIRQLLIDGNPLLSIVNKNYKLPILFRTQKNRPKFQTKGTINGIAYESVIGVTFVNPKHNDEAYIDNIILEKFIEYPVIFFEGQYFTVLQIIKQCAHIYGGVHSGKARNEDEFKLDLANKTLSHGEVSCAIDAMRDIISITITALEPLVAAIQKMK